MNKEIERILGTSGKYITYAEKSYVLDYITNLKQENERLKEELLSKPDNEITLTTKEGQELTIIQSKRIDMQETLNKSLEEMYKKLNDYKSRIDKANEVLESILVISDWEHKGRYRPVKNTTAQDVYKTICKLYGILETPYRSDYGALTGGDEEWNY